jgi:hypothetical protein
VRHPKPISLIGHICYKFDILLIYIVVDARLNHLYLKLNTIVTRINRYFNRYTYTLTSLFFYSCMNIFCLKERKSKQKKSTLIEAEPDRISCLPGHLTDQILSFLPIKEAVRTSVLSSKWRKKWYTIPNLVFD